MQIEDAKALIGSDGGVSLLYMADCERRRGEEKSLNMQYACSAPLSVTLDSSAAPTIPTIQIVFCIFL